MDDRDEWQWDSSLYSGSAIHYVRGRVPYPVSLVDLIVGQAGLNGTGRLLDLGCGPGSLTVPLAAHVREAVGVDPDAAMLSQAARYAERAAATNTTWLEARAEDLSDSWGMFRLVTLAQSFHWMDRPKVAALVHHALSNDGQLVFVHATTHEGVRDAAPGPFPQPPRREIEDLVRDYLGPRRRAGAGHRNERGPSEGARGLVEAEIFRAAGFTGPRRHEIPAREVTRTSDEIADSIFSLSYAAPHLFGDQLSAFEHDLRSLIERSSSTGRFSETMREIAVDVWEP